VDLPTVVSLWLAVVIVMKNICLKEIPETCILYFFNIGRYGWIVSMQSGVRMQLR
jgi:hypothetical protein